MDKEALDVLRKHTVTMTALAKALDRLSGLIEKKMPLNLEVGSETPNPGKRPVDRYELADREFRAKYGEANGRVAPRKQPLMDDAEATRMAQEEIDSRAGA